MKHIINKTSIILFINNKPYEVDKTTPLYSRIINAFDLPKEEQDAKITELVLGTSNSSNSNTETGKLKIINNEVYFDEEKLPKILSNIVLRIQKDGLSLEIFEEFWKNLRKNPSASSVTQLYDFLAYKELPLTEDGHFLAYKGVDGNYLSIHGNTETKVIKGKVTSQGKIYNTIGSEIEVQRNAVDDDRDNHCSFGLHVGSLDYASSFATKVVIVKVNPADVVSVPIDYNCQKCRVSAYTVVADFEGEITATAVDDDVQEIVCEDVKTLDAFHQRLSTYLEKKKEKMNSITVRQIQNSFSPDYPSRQKILDAVVKIGYSWKDVEKPYIVLKN